MKMLDAHHFHLTVNSFNALTIEPQVVLIGPRVRRHVATTGGEDCRVVVDTLRPTISLYRALPQPAMPEHFRERLYRTLHLEAYLPDSSTTTAQNEEAHEGD